MLDLDAVVMLLESVGNFLGNHDGAVLASRASEGDGEITFAFVDVMGEQEEQQISDFLEEFAGLGKFANVAGDLGILSSEGAELGNEMWVRQKAHVKDQIGL